MNGKITRKIVNLTFTFSLIFFSFSSFANSININLQCPRTKNDGGTTGIFVVFNNGITISGTGHEYINGVNVDDPIWAGRTPPGVPLEIEKGAYYRSGVFYDSAGSKVKCLYTSSVGYPPFDISYNVRRGIGGEVIYQTVNSIMLRFEFGYKADHL